MSSLRSSANSGTAWLRDSSRTTAVRIDRRSSEPEDFAFFAPDFALNDGEPWLLGERTEAVLAPPPLPLPEITHRIDPSPTAFAALFEDITARLGRDEFRKVVPIVAEDLRFSKDLDLAMFPRVLEAPPRGQYAYGFGFGDEGLCGVTPEVLFKVQEGRLETMALAGTAAADGPDLLEDPKERREHALVVENLGQELRRFGEVHVGATEERAFGALKHLHTPISVDLSRAPSFLDLVVRLHPTAALGGFPRRPAIEWLERQPFHVARRRFGAPFGFQDGEEMMCVVAIRGLQWRGPRLTIAAGCGIVAGSVVEREWRELELKRRAIYQNLGLTI